MRRTLKGVPIWLFILVSVLVASPLVAAWIVYTGPIANVSLSINKAAAVFEPNDIVIGSVDSGASFSGKATSVMMLENAEMFDVFFEVITMTDEEAAALQSLTVTIGPDEDGDGEMDYPWGWISLKDPEKTIIVELSKGDYNVVILVEGVAGYPEAESPVVDFSVIATVETPLTGDTDPD